MKKIFFVMLGLASMVFGADYDKFVCSQADQSGCKALYETLRNDCIKASKKEACELGAGLLAQSKDANHYKLGVELVEKGCKLGSGASCLIIADLHAEGLLGVKKDIDKAMEYGEKACLSEAKGAKAGCAILGRVYASMPAYKNLNKAIEYSKMACENGVAQGCFTLGNVYYAEFKELDKSFENYKKACDLNYYPGCNGLGIAYNNGFGAEKNSKKAFELFDLACKNGDMPACLNQGKLYYFGDGVKKDEKKAKALAKKVCDAGIKEGCKGLWLAEHHAIKQDTGGIGIIETHKVKRK